MVQRVLDWVFKREREKPDVPVCPNHDVPMQMRGVMGRPARFSYQTEETYTVIYFCPVPGCAETAEVQLAMTQIPGAGRGAAPPGLRPPGLSGRAQRRDSRPGRRRRSREPSAHSSVKNTSCSKRASRSMRMPAGFSTISNAVDRPRYPASQTAVPSVAPMRQRLDRGLPSAMRSFGRSTISLKTIWYGPRSQIQPTRARRTAMARTSGSDRLALVRPMAPPFANSPTSATLRSNPLG